MSSKRVQARAIAADVAGQKGEVDESQDVVDRVVVLGDPEGPADLRGGGFGVGVSQLTDRLGRYARDLLRVLECVGLDLAPIVFEPLRGAIDKRAIAESGSDNLAGHGVGQGDVRAHVESQPHVGPARRRSPPRIHDIEPRSRAAPP